MAAIGTMQRHAALDFHKPIADFEALKLEAAPVPPPPPPPPPLASLAKLRESLAEEVPELLMQKVRGCAALFHFGEPSVPEPQASEREAKRQTLLELVEYVGSTRVCFGELLPKEIVDMVALNIFRTMPHIESVEGGEPPLERSWSHLQLVYEFFLRFVASNDVDVKVAKRHVDQSFVVRLLQLFNSGDPRERDYLKSILHRIYGRFMTLRPFVRKAIQQLFYEVIYESESQNGLAELLEVVGSIANGFALPLKEEHLEFFAKAVVPLHKVQFLAAFHAQLSHCLVQYVEKDPRLALDVVDAMLRYWPASTTGKQVLFLNELEELLELMRPQEFQRVQDALMRRVVRCISCPQIQVAERALFLWNSEYVVQLFHHSRHALFPIIVRALCTNTKEHWSGTIRGLSLSVLRLLMEADPALVDSCTVQYTAEEAAEAETRESSAAKWAALQAAHDHRRAKSAGV